MSDTDKYRNLIRLVKDVLAQHGIELVQHGIAFDVENDSPRDAIQLVGIVDPAVLAPDAPVIDEAAFARDQVELSDEERALFEMLEGDPLLSNYDEKRAMEDDLMEQRQAVERERMAEAAKRMAETQRRLLGGEGLFGGND